MGLMKDVKGHLVKTQAERAMKEGRQIFVCRFDPGMTAKHNASGSISGVAEMIESVEGAGWKLDRFIEAPEHAFTGLFRR